MLILCYGTLSIAPCIAPQGGPNGVNHLSMYLGYHNIEIKTRDLLKLNFGIWNIVRFLAGFYVNVHISIHLIQKDKIINIIFQIEKKLHVNLQSGCIQGVSPLSV